MASKDPPESYKKNQKVREPAWARLPGCLFVPPRTERRRANDSEPPSEHVSDRVAVCGQAMYFVKTHEEPVAMDTVSSHVMVGDFFAQDLRGQGNPLQYFDAMSHDVFLPLVSSASIVGAWPDTLTKEVMGQLHKMLANIHRTIGESHGTTQLPLPSTETSPLMDEKEKNYQLETSVVDWAHQIKNILKLDPESELKAGNDVGPTVEIEFWRHKAKNLNAIHEQLTGSRMQKVIEVLEESKWRRWCRTMALDICSRNGSKIRREPPTRPQLSKGAE